MSEATRPWCANIQYPGKKPVLFGTIHCEARAAFHEIERDMRAEIDGCLPDGFKLVGLVPGEMIFWPSEERKAA